MMMMINEINAFQELWNEDENEKAIAMGQPKDPEPEMTDEEMFIDLIEIYGLEAPVVINFAYLMESGFSHKSLKLTYDIIMDYPTLYI